MIRITAAPTSFCSATNSSLRQPDDTMASSVLRRVFTDCLTAACMSAVSLRMAAAMGVCTNSTHLPPARAQAESLFTPLQASNHAAASALPPPVLMAGKALNSASADA